MMLNKVLSLTGLAVRAGKVVSGEFAVENAIRDGKAWLVIVTEDASDNTKKKFRDKSAYYEVPYVVLGTKETLGHAIGKEMRASLAITDKGFAENILKHLEQSEK